MVEFSLVMTFDLAQKSSALQHKFVRKSCGTPHKSAVFGAGAGCFHFSKGDMLDIAIFAMDSSNKKGRTTLIEITELEIGFLIDQRNPGEAQNPFNNKDSRKILIQREGFAKEMQTTPYNCTVFESKELLTFEHDGYWPFTGVLTLPNNRSYSFDPEVVVGGGMV